MRAERALAAMYGEDYPLAGILAKAGRDLKMIRVALGWTQRELAAEIGTNQMQVYNVEQGKRLATQVRSLVQYADALGYKMVITFVPTGDEE